MNGRIIYHIVHNQVCKTMSHTWINNQMTLQVICAKCGNDSFTIQTVLVRKNNSLPISTYVCIRCGTIDETEERQI